MRRQPFLPPSAATNCLTTLREPIAMFGRLNALQDQIDDAFIGTTTRRSSCAERGRGPRTSLRVRRAVASRIDLGAPRGRLRLRRRRARAGGTRRTHHRFDQGNRGTCESDGVSIAPGIAAFHERPRRAAHTRGDVVHRALLSNRAAETIESAAPLVVPPRVSAGPPLAEPALERSEGLASG